MLEHKSPIWPILPEMLKVCFHTGAPSPLRTNPCLLLYTPSPPILLPFSLSFPFPYPYPSASPSTKLPNKTYFYFTDPSQILFCEKARTERPGKV